MSKHTQAAWRYVDGYLDCEVWAGNRKILSYERHPTDEDRANARLMAAAPELLETLRILTSDLSFAIENDGDDASKDSRIMRARAVISKATGCDL